MRNSRRSLIARAIRPRQARLDRITVPYLWVPLHYQGSAANKCEHFGTVIGEGELAVGGTTTNAWDNAGWLSGNTTDGNYTHTQDAAVKAMLQLAGRSGGVIACADYYFTTNGTNNHCILSASPGDTAGGGWRINARTTGYVDFIMRGQGGSAVTLQQTDLTAAGWKSGRILIVTYIDCKNEVWLGYIRKNALSDATLNVSINAAALSAPLPVNSAYGLGMGCRINSDGPYTAGEVMGETAHGPEGARLANVLIAGVNSDFSGELTALLKEMWHVPGEVPTTLVNAS